MGDSQVAEFDIRVRAHVYDEIMTSCRFPSIRDVVRSVGVEEPAVRDAFRRMQDAHVLVLQTDSDEILMANPFSAVPTPFVVRVGTQSWWGNCIWDALGIVAMTGGDGNVLAACGDCGDELLVRIGGGELVEGEGIVHFALPARRWWDNIRFT
jgi:hypothetical protein